MENPIDELRRRLRTELGVEGEVMRVPSQEEIQAFLALASFMPPRDDGQTCLIIGTTRASELIHSWLSGTLVVAEELIEKAIAQREKCFSEEGRQLFAKSLRGAGSYMKASEQ